MRKIDFAVCINCVDQLAQPRHNINRLCIFFLSYIIGNFGMCTQDSRSNLLCNLVSNINLFIMMECPMHVNAFGMNFFIIKSKGIAI